MPSINKQIIQLNAEVPYEMGGQRLDQVAALLFAEHSRSRLSAWIKEGLLTVDGAVLRPRDIVHGGSLLALNAEQEAQGEWIAQDIALNIVYEDEQILVIDKPAGLVVHPGHGNYTGTLVNALAYYLKDDPYYDPSDPRLGLVHRIDKDTSGLLVVAKHPEAKSNLSLQFFNKTTKRKYRALVWGIVQEDEGRIEGNIGRDPRDRMQMTVFPEGDQGKTAVTHYTVLERLGYVSLVECRLETGRTHQIRVHMKYIGHTLFNDERYGGHDILKGTTFTKYKQFVQNCFAICPRQALHAKTLGFVHPTTGEEMFFDSEIPSDMQQLIDRWRVYANTKEL